MSKQRLFAEAALRRVDASIHSSRVALASCDAVDAYDQLVDAVRSRTAVLARRSSNAPRARPSFTGHTGGGPERPDVERALAAMALYAAAWLRPVAAWAPPTGSAFPVLASLAEHLFARYAMPRFLASVWRDGKGAVARLPQHTWYQRLGTGESVRRIGLPIRLTRAMAHRFLQAPDHFTVIHALRWAQIRTMGGSDELVRAVLGTRLGQSQDNEAAWENVLHFVARHPELPLDEIGSIVDFVHDELEPHLGFAPDGSYGVRPAGQFSSKGRTLASLLRLIGERRAALGRFVGERVAWPRAAIGELVHVEQADGTRPEAQDGHGPVEEARVWTITELCSGHALAAEGQAMQHCVATYLARCCSGYSSVWSLQLETVRGRRRVATIEVRMPSRRIAQTSRMRNKVPSRKALAVIALWAVREGLVLDWSACGAR